MQLERSRLHAPANAAVTTRDRVTPGDARVTPGDTSSRGGRAARKSKKKGRPSASHAGKEIQDGAPLQHWHAGDEAMIAQLERILEWWLDVGLDSSLEAVQQERYEVYPTQYLGRACKRR